MSAHPPLPKHTGSAFSLPFHPRHCLPPKKAPVSCHHQIHLRGQAFALQPSQAQASFRPIPTHRAQESCLPKPMRQERASFHQLPTHREQVSCLQLPKRSERVYGRPWRMDSAFCPMRRDWTRLRTGWASRCRSCQSRSQVPYRTRHLAGRMSLCLPKRSIPGDMCCLFWGYLFSILISLCRRNSERE